MESWLTNDEVSDLIGWRALACLLQLLAFIIRRERLLVCVVSSLATMTFSYGSLASQLVNCSSSWRFFMLANNEVGYEFI